MSENQFLFENVIIIAGFIFFSILFILIWFIPVLCSRKNENATAILWINLLLGWIPFVWLILLLAALLGRKKNQ